MTLAWFECSPFLDFGNTMGGTQRLFSELWVFSLTTLVAFLTALDQTQFFHQLYLFACITKTQNS